MEGEESLDLLRVIAGVVLYSMHVCIVEIPSKKIIREKGKGKEEKGEGSEGRGKGEGRGGRIHILAL